VVVVEVGAAAEAAVEVAEASQMRIGVGYRHELANWLTTRPPGIGCLELTAEHFYRDPRRLAQVANLRTGEGSSSTPWLFVHGLGLSLGTPGPLDENRLSQFVHVAATVQADWISEHVAFTRTAEVDLGHLNPVPPTRDLVKIMADHSLELAARCGKPLLLENITSHIRLEGELSETEFLNELCARADCHLLLDVTNLFVNSRNHGFDPIQWVHEIEPRRIRQLHIVGYSHRNGRYTDDHSQSVQPELLELARTIINYAPVQALILERDCDFADDHGMAAEILKLQTLNGAN